MDVEWNGRTFGELTKEEQEAVCSKACRALEQELNGLDMAGVLAPKVIGVYGGKTHFESKWASGKAACGLWPNRIMRERKGPVTCKSCLAGNQIAR